MSILGIVFPTTGLADASPQLLYIKTNDTLATVITANYLDQAKAIYGNIFSNYQMAIVYTSDAKSVILQVLVSSDGVHASLASAPAGSETFTNILVAAGTAAAPSYSFVGHTGTGMYYSNTNTVGFAANGLLSFQVASTAGTVNSVIASGGATNAANAALQPGFTAFGTDTNIDVAITGKATGGLAVLASTTGVAGYLKLWNGAGNFAGKLTFAALAQNTTLTMADIGAATGGLVVATAAVLMKRVANAAVAGGAAAQVVTDAFCTSAACTVIANWRDTTTPASVLTVLAGNGSFTVTSSADPGASHLDYVIYK